MRGFSSLPVRVMCRSRKTLKPVAQQLSLLGFFIDSLQHGEADFDTFARRLHGVEQPVTEEATEDEVSAPPSVEAQVEQDMEATQILFEAFREPPDDGQIREELKDNLQSLQTDAVLLENLELGDTAKAAIETPAPSAATIELAHSSHEEIDAELLEIFLEEANEVLATIGDQSAQLAVDPRNTEALTTLRRSAHTLKGSGRMVGLTDMGDAAWALEQTLNMWLRQDMVVTPELLALIAEAHNLFSRWVAALEQRAADIPDPSTMVALAEALRGEEPRSLAPVPAGVVHSVELPIAEAGESPSAVLDLPVSPEWAGEPEAVPAGEAGAELIAELPFAPIAEQTMEPVLEIAEPIAEQASEMAEMFADFSVPEDHSCRGDFRDHRKPPVEPVAQVAPTLYDIFREEARGHLETLVAGYGELEVNPSAPTSFEITRAAHTLGGIAATVGLMPLNHLAIALEHALLRRDSSGRPESIGGLETVRQAIITLEQMFAGLARQEAPSEQLQLISALEDVFLVEPQAEISVVESPAAAGRGVCQPDRAGNRAGCRGCRTDCGHAGLEAAG